MSSSPDVRLLTGMAEHEELAGLFARIWGVAEPSQIYAAHTLRALAFAGNYVAGVYAGGRLVAGAVAYFAAGGRLHSDVAGVEESQRGRGLGLAVKLHQRDFALAHGIKCIQWTFDPGRFRNARFNIHRLGARAVAYLPDFYGRMDDRLNAGTGPSDRLLVEWQLDSPRVAAALAKRPRPARGRRIPMASRQRLRRELTAAFDEGLCATGVSADEHYIMEGPR